VYIFVSLFLSDLLADFAQPQLCLAYSGSEFSIDYRDRHKFNQFSPKHALFCKLMGCSFTIGLAVVLVLHTAVLVTIKSYQKENSLSSYVLLFHFLFIVALRPIIMKFYFFKLDLFFGKHSLVFRFFCAVHARSIVLKEKQMLMFLDLTSNSLYIIQKMHLLFCLWGLLEGR